jgi:succinoglycan biosynthesis transport protein ExoP
MDGFMDGPSQQQGGTRPLESRNTDPARRFATDHGTHLLDRLNVVYKYRYVVVSIFLLIVLNALLRAYTTTPLYRARARLMIEMQDERTAAMASAINSASSSYWQDPKVFYETQYRILTGSGLARRVVRRIDLGRVSEFSAARPALTGLNRLLSMPRRTPSRTEPEASTPPESTLINQLLARVSVEPVENSRLADVAFVSADPAFAVRAADTLADEYVQLNLELRRQNMVASLEWLSQELVKQQKKVGRASAPWRSTARIRTRSPSRNARTSSSRGSIS